MNIQRSFLLDKVAQRPKMVKTKQAQDAQVFFDYLTSDEINVLDHNLVSGEFMEIRYEHTTNFIEADSKTNVMIAAFTTAYARLKLYDVIVDMMDHISITTITSYNLRRA